MSPDQKQSNEEVLAKLKEQDQARLAAKGACGLALPPEKYEKNEQLLDWIRPVQDPEMLISVVDLGLIYHSRLSVDGKKADVIMTLTSPGCPVADLFVNNVKTRLLEYSGVEQAEVKLVFEPKWDPATMASDEVKDKLGIW